MYTLKIKHPPHKDRLHSSVAHTSDPRECVSNCRPLTPSHRCSARSDLQKLWTYTVGLPIIIINIYALYINEFTVHEEPVYPDLIFWTDIWVDYTPFSESYINVNKVRFSNFSKQASKFCFKGNKYVQSLGAYIAHALKK